MNIDIDQAYVEDQLASNVPVYVVFDFKNRVRVGCLLNILNEKEVPFLFTDELHEYSFTLLI